MEVSGQKQLRNLLSSTLRLGSEEETGLYCHPCELSGKSVKATGYCQNCREHLCEQCINSHKKATPSRNHAVDRTTRTVGASIASDTLLSCSTHQNEEVKLYCRAHGKLGCVICMTLSHKSCEIDYIPDVSVHFLGSDEYLTFEKYIFDLKELCTLNISEIEGSCLNVEETFLKIMSAVKQTKKEVIDSLDKFEKELEEAVGEYRKTNIDAMESLKRDYETFARDIVETESAANRMKKSKMFNSLFYEVKHATTKIQEYHSRAYALATRDRIQQCTFEKSTELDTILTKERLFGSIEINDWKLGVCNLQEKVIRKRIGDINIKAVDDKKTCYATGLAFLSADQLAVADKANKNVKIVDVTYDKMISKIALSSSPRDITVLPPSKLAVTLRDEKIIQLLSTESGLTKLEQIKTDGKCRGIEYYDGKLLVTFDNFLCNIQILSLTGQVLSRFEVDQKGKMLMHEPKCLAISPDLRHIYVTDFMKMSVFRLSQIGHVTAVYTSSSPHFMGIVVSNGGSVYVCTKFLDSIVQLSDELTNDKVVLNEQDGIKGPIGLAFSKTKNTLYVSCGKGGEKTCDKLHAFKIN